MIFDPIGKLLDIRGYDSEIADDELYFVRSETKLLDKFWLPHSGRLAYDQNTNTLQLSELNSVFYPFRLIEMISSHIQNINQQFHLTYELGHQNKICLLMEVKDENSGDIQFTRMACGLSLSLSSNQENIIIEISDFFQFKFQDIDGLSILLQAIQSSLSHYCGLIRPRKLGCLEVPLKQLIEKFSSQYLNRVVEMPAVLHHTTTSLISENTTNINWLSSLKEKHQECENKFDVLDDWDFHWQALFTKDVALKEDDLFSLPDREETHQLSDSALSLMGFYLQNKPDHVNGVNYDFSLRENENLMLLSLKISEAMGKNNTHDILRKSTAFFQKLAKNYINIELSEQLDKLAYSLFAQGWQGIEPRKEIFVRLRLMETNPQAMSLLLQILALLEQIDDQNFYESTIKLLWNLTYERAQFIPMIHFIAKSKQSDDALLHKALVKLKELEPSRELYLCGLEILKRLENSVNIIDHLDSFSDRFIDCISDQDKEILHWQIVESLLNKRAPIARVSFLILKLIESNKITDLFLDKAAHYQYENAIDMKWIRYFDLLVTQSLNRKNKNAALIFLCHIFKNQEINEEKIDFYISRIGQMARIDIKDLRFFHNEKLPDIAWYGLIHLCLRIINGMSDEQCVPYWRWIGDIYTEKLDLLSQGIAYYEKTFDAGDTDVSTNRRLYDYFESISNRSKQVEILRLSEGKNNFFGSERELLTQLFRIESSINPDMAMETARKIYRLFTDIDPVYQILNQFLQHSKQDSFIFMLQWHYENVGTNFDDYLENSIDIVSSKLSLHEGSFFIDLLDHEKSAQKDSIECYFRSLFNALKNYKREVFSHLFQDMIEKKCIPDLGLSYYEDLLESDSKDFEQYIEMLSENLHCKEEKHTLIRQALNSLGDGQKKVSLSSSLYHQLADTSSLSVDEWRSFYEIASLQKSINSFVLMLEKALSRMNQHQLSAEMFQFIIDIARDAPDVQSGFLNSTLKLVDKMDLDIRLNYQLEIFEVTKNPGDFFDRSFGYEYLANDHNWDCSPLFQKIFVWLASESEDSLQIIDLSRNVFRRLLSQGRSKDVAELADFLRSYDIREKNANWAAFQYFVVEGKLTKARSQWLEGIQILLSKDEIQRFIKNTRSYLDECESNLDFDSLISYTFLSGNIDSMAETIADELKMEFALILFRKNQEQERSCNYLASYYEKNPAENRIWLPLYFLLSARGADEEIYKLLKHIIPLIAQHSDLIVDFPVTIESLEKSFLDAAHKLELSADLENYTFGSKTKDSVAEDEIPFNMRYLANVDTQFNLISGDETAIRTMFLTSELARAPGTFALSSYSDTTEKMSSVLKSRNFDSSAFRTKSPDEEGTLVFQDQAYSSFSDNDRQAISSLNHGQGSVNWRRLVFRDDFSSEDFGAMMMGQFPSIIEEHFAFQIGSIMAADLSKVDTWKFAIWRNKGARFTDKFIDVSSLPSDCFSFDPLDNRNRFILDVLPLWADFYQERFSLRAIAKRFSIPVDVFLARRRQVQFDDPWLSQSQLGLFEDSWKERGYRLYDVHGIGRSVVFEGKQGAFYFDYEFWSKRKVNHFYHRLKIEEFAVELCYDKLFVMLNMPKIIEITRFSWHMLRDGMIEKLREAEFEGYKAFESVSSGDLKRLINLTASVDHVEMVLDLKYIRNLMLDQILFLQALESLDLIGLVETVFGKDFEKDPLGVKNLKNDPKLDRLIKNIVSARLDRIFG